MNDASHTDPFDPYSYLILYIERICGFYDILMETLIFYEVISSFLYFYPFQTMVLAASA